MSNLSDVSDDSILKREPDGAADSIRFEKLSHRYRPDADEVLKDIDFGIRRGEVFGIIGRSGAGKSTLVRTINLLERPSGGRVLVNGEDLSGFDEATLARARRRIGMVFQHFNLMASKTVAENIALPLRIAGVPAEEVERKLATLLETVGLTAKRDVYPARLSGGQKQRVGIARALVHDPDILLCDEATSALDPETTESILALIGEINRRLGITVVLITHEMEVIRQVCDRVAVMEKGRVVELAEVWKVFGDPASDASRALLRAANADLPDVLRAQLRDEPTGADAVVLELLLDGSHAQGPDLAALSASLGGGELRLVHGRVERIQGRVQGRLVVALARTEGLRLPFERPGEPALSKHRIRKLGYLHDGRQDSTTDHLRKGLHHA